jgi:hypothetical protein
MMHAPDLKKSNQLLKKLRFRAEIYLSTYLSIHPFIIIYISRLEELEHPHRATNEGAVEVYFLPIIACHVGFCLSLFLQIFCNIFLPFPLFYLLTLVRSAIFDRYFLR